VLDAIPLDRAGFACTLGGRDGRTLFMLSADWRMQDGFEDNIQRLTTGPKTGQVLTAPAPTPATRDAPALRRAHLPADDVEPAGPHPRWQSYAVDRARTASSQLSQPRSEGHCCIEPEGVGEPQPSGGSPHPKGEK